MTEDRRPCPKCGEMIAEQALICRFCKADFRPAPRAAPAAPPPRRKGFPVVLIVVLIVAVVTVPFVAIIAAIAIPGLVSAQRAANERNAACSLKTLCTAEIDFRSKDRDGNGVNDFWTGDVAGLYCLHAGGSKEPMRLIEISIAAADAAPLKEGAAAGRRGPFPDPAQPKCGYRYRVMTHDETGEPYGQDTKGKPPAGPYFNPGRFAFCAYPAKYPSAGRRTFIVDESATVWMKDTRGEPVTRWPSDPGAEGWLSMD